MVTRRKAELVENINLRGMNTHGYKISKIQIRKEVKDKWARKLKYRASFQISIGSWYGIWYIKDDEKYSVTSSNAIKEKVVKDEVLSKRIGELERLLTEKHYFNCCSEHRRIVIRQRDA